jgi:hypothetical protein
MSRGWTPRRVARLGYLAGRGLSLESIMADDALAARSESSVRHAASRWGVPLGQGTPFTLLLGADDRVRLAEEAAERGMDARMLATRIVETVMREKLIEAVLGGETMPSVCAELGSEG